MSRPTGAITLQVVRARPRVSTGKKREVLISHTSMQRALIVFVLCVVPSSRPAAGQSVENRLQLGIQLAGAVSGEFEDTDVGIGVHFSWHPMVVVGAEAEVGIYPENFAGVPAFSGSRVEGLFGVTVGPGIGRLRPFAKLRSGFVTFHEAPEPLACIAIFPPPLPCALASGRTVFAIDLGGGAEWFQTGRTFLRVDVSDRLMRYPGPVLRRDRSAREDASFSHDFRFAIGAGVRF